MGLKNKIQVNNTQALKAGNKEKLEALRYLNAQINDKEIAQGRKELTDEEIVKLINGQIKKLDESLSFFEKGGRKKLAEKTSSEITILKTYLPKQLSDEELEKEIEKIVKDNPNLPHPGALIGIAIKKLGAKADNKKISQITLKKFKNKV